jgi:hypothetical protein
MWGICTSLRRNLVGYIFKNIITIPMLVTKMSRYNMERAFGNVSFEYMVSQTAVGIITVEEMLTFYA